LQLLIYNLRISHSKGSFVQKIQQKRKKAQQNAISVSIALASFDSLP
jgi:hypothetical protein